MLDPRIVSVFHGACSGVIGDALQQPAIAVAEEQSASLLVQDGGQAAELVVTEVDVIAVSVGHGDERNALRIGPPGGSSENLDQPARVFQVVRL